MFDVIRSNIIFFRAHRSATILLTATLSLIFFVMLMQHALSFPGISEVEKYRSEYYSMYHIRYVSADQSTTASLIEVTNDLSTPVEYVNIYGEVVLADSEADGNVTSDSQNVMDLDTGSSQSRLILLGIDPVCTLPIDVLRGSSPQESGGIMAEAFGFYSLQMSLGSDDSGEYFITLANGDVKPITCIGSLRTWEQFPDLVVQREDFFSLTDSSVSLIAVFERPLTEEEEKSWINEIAGIVSIEGVTRPQDYLSPILNEQNTNILMSRVIIVVCLLCTLRLMTYLFLLRKQEFIVLRMLGASTLRIGAHVVTMLLGVAGVSIVIGGIVYFGVASIPIVAKILYPLTPQWIVSDVGFFLAAVLMSGICMFFMNARVDVTRASEEV